MNEVQIPDGLLAIAADVDAAEIAMLGMPQVEIPTVHHFGPEIYIREVTMPAGSVIIGHAHRSETTNQMLSGRIIVIDGDGTRREMVAPHQFVSPPGRKVAYIVEETVWQNVWANPDNETDIAVLEDRYCEKSTAWLAHHEQAHLVEEAV